MAKQSTDARYSATQVESNIVGSYFVEQYYEVFLHQRESLCRFYSDESRVIRVDGKISRSASNKAQIHELIMSLNLVEIEIKTVNSLESLNGGVLLVVSGFAKLRDFSGQRKFLQTFFLAPQEGGYFALNDMFHFANDEVVHQPAASSAQEHNVDMFHFANDEVVHQPSAPSVKEHNVDMFHFANDEAVHQPSAPATQEQNVDYQPTISTHLPADPVVSDSGNAVEEEVNDCISSLHIQGEKSVEEFDYQKLLQPQPEQETNLESEPKLELQPKLEPDPIQEPKVNNSLEEKIPFEKSTASLKNNEISALQPLAEELVKQPVKTYASILMAKGKSPPSKSSRPPLAANHVSHPSLEQSCSILPNSSLITVEEPLSSAEGESKVVYVKNLSSTITSLDILFEFKNFGKIKHDGVLLRHRQDTDACYAFVEFEDVQSALNAIKASPIQLVGRRVYIEQKKSKVGSSRGGIRVGRGSGGLGGSTFVRESEQNCCGNGGVRTNGFR